MQRHTSRSRTTTVGAGQCRRGRCRWVRPRVVATLWTLLVAALIASALTGREGVVSAQGGARLAVSFSSPIALTNDDRFLWVANPDNDTVSVFEVAGDANRKIAEIAVGREPQSIAITPDDRTVYVTNQVDGTVSVIDARFRVVRETIPVGTEPHGCALTPDGTKLYVANMTSDDVTVIDTRPNPFPGLHVRRGAVDSRFNAVIRTIPVDPQPFAIAITASGEPEKVYVTHFFAQLRPDSRSVVEKEGRDDGKEGRVTVIATASDSVIGRIALSAVADTGFFASGSTLDRVAAAGASNRPTGAYPNQLRSIAIKGNRAYVPSTAPSPNGPSRLDLNAQYLLSVIDLARDQESQSQTFNLARGIDFEPGDRSIFPADPSAIAFKRGANEGYVVAGGAEYLFRVELAADGSPTLRAPRAAGAAGNVIRIPVGKNPRGIVINSSDTRAYVLNYVSRDVSIIDIQAGSSRANTEIARVASAALPTAGTLDAIILRGKWLFNTAIGPPGTRSDTKPPFGRMSSRAWGTCYTCHPEGRSDGVTWMMGGGPRQSPAMDGDFAHPQPPNLMLNANGAPILTTADQRVMNWTANRDEIADAEGTLRGQFGGEGLITDGLSIAGLGIATTGRSAEMDALVAYVAFGVRSPIAPPPDRDARLGRLLFARANCQSCHGGPKWARSRVEWVGPPPASELQNGVLFRFLKKVGTYDPTAFNEIRSNLQPADGADGFNIPSLIGVFATAPYLHSGAAQTLDDVLENVVHRSAGTNGVDTLSHANDRKEVVRFLKTIDTSTVPFP